MALARRRPSRLRFVVALLVMASLTLITLDVSGRGAGALRSARAGFAGALAPVQEGMHAALRPVGNFFTGAVDYGRLQADNTVLRTQLDRLRSQQAAAAYAQQQADQVLALQHLPFAAGVHTLTAQIVDVGASNFAAAVTVDRGTADGVRTGEPVVAAGGLAGTVTAASRHHATVTLLTDPSFVVGVSLPGGETGSATGQGPQSPLRVTVLPSTKDSPPRVAKGAVLSTSGLSMEDFPPGIPVGRVTAVTTPAGETEPTVSLSPLVDPATLHYVDILLWSPQ